MRLTTYSGVGGVGPLKLGEIGTLRADDGSVIPFFVEASDGTKWWYREKAIELADGLAAAVKAAARAASVASFIPPS